MNTNKHPGKIFKSYPNDAAVRDRVSVAHAEPGRVAITVNTERFAEKWDPAKHVGRTAPGASASMAHTTLSPADARELGQFLIQLADEASAGAQDGK